MEKSHNEIKKMVRDGYAKVVTKKTSCCCSGGCCETQVRPEDISRKVGYSREEVVSVPEGANLGLGCGNPVALALLKEGDTVLDLGSGAGFDAFLASMRVGKTGRVIGVDMTPEMVDKARANAKKGHYENVEFRLGEIEELPVDENSINVIISNCVINLSPDKPEVFREAFRVLKPGGRLMVSDLVLVKELSEAVKKSAEAYVGCLAGASRKEDYLSFIRKAGFQNIEVIEENDYPVEAIANDAAAQAVTGGAVGRDDLQDIGSAVVSIKVKAVKPGE